MSFYNQLHIDKGAIERFNPYYCNLESSLTDPIIINGQEFINLASNNYLGLASDERVKEAMINAIKRYGASMCGTPIATGYVDILKKVEERLSKFIGLEDTAIFPSCYQANLGLFSSIVNDKDLIIVDHYAHASLIQGIRLTGCKVKPFLHNDTAHLEKVLQKSSDYQNIFVVTESVFSTEGSLAPFEKIVNLCENYHAIAVVDDSHGIGVIGKSGRGILEEKGIVDFQGIYTASLGKALANSGGIISGKKELIEFLRYSCSSLIYSTALPPAVIGGIDKVLDIIEEDFESIAARMWRYKRLISECLQGCGLKLAEGTAPITSIIGGSLENTIAIAEILFENHILPTPFVPPSVPPNQGKVRLIAGADLKETTMEKVLGIFKEVRF
ncbi:MAG: pyridoxal phosphate-dependent aminotransferase family protein [Candidatus Omnitrophica bacterium]|nr:pyridoxal phosphate-dependent aminotransferase family protein [Candidatus Omnitrophota bacterium]